MPVTKIGLVYYADDPHHRVFRTIYPEFDDSELDGPPTDGQRKVYRETNGNPHSWMSLGTDSARVALMEKVPLDISLRPKRNRGTPFTPASEPMVYVIGFNLVPMNFAEQAMTFLTVNPRWSNILMIPLDALPPSLVSPSWVIAIDAIPPGLGTPDRQRAFGGHTVSMWRV